MELLCALVAFFALVVSWFALPAAPRAAAHVEPLARPVDVERIPTAA